MASTDVRYMRLPEVMERVALRKTKIYDMIDKNEFPKPRKAGRASLWLSSAIEDWMTEHDSLS